MANNTYELGLGLSEEHVELAESVRKFTERHLSQHILRTAVDAKSEAAAPFWREVAEQGLLGLHVPEADGGQGAGLLEQAVALEALGRAAHTGPFLPTVLASALLVTAAADIAEKLLPGLVDGSQVAAVGLAEALEGTPSGDAVMVSGCTNAVLGGAQADVLLLPVRIGEATTWVAFDAADLAIREQDSLDISRVAPESRPT